MSTDAADAANTSPLIYRGHSDYIFALAFSPDSTYVASAARDTTVRVWRVNQTRSTRDIEDITIYHEHKGSLLSVAWSPDGKYITSGVPLGAVQGQDAPTPKTLGHHRGHQ